jgi:hypothetical protein
MADSRKKHVIVICAEGLESSTGLQKKGLAAGMAAAGAFLDVIRASEIDPKNFKIRVERQGKHACFTFVDDDGKKSGVPIPPLPMGS